MHTGYFIGEDCYIHDENGATDWYYGGDRQFYLLIQGHLENLGYYFAPEDDDWSSGPILQEPGIWTGYVMEAGQIHGPDRSLPWEKSNL
jgi:hypothetical protein